MKRTLAIWALTAAEVMAQSTMTGSKTMQGSWDASGASATKPAKSGATLPTTCNIGEFFFNTAAAAGQNLYLCATANTWTQVTSGASGSVNSVFGRTGTVSAQSGDYSFSQLSGTASSSQLPAAGGDLSGALTSATVQGIQGKAVSATAPTSGQTLVWSGTQWAPQTVSNSPGGDLSGTIAAATVQGIQGKAVSATAPTSGQTLVWSGTQWAPQTVSNSPGGDLSGTIAAATVQGIQGKAVSTTAPTSGQTLVWSGTQWAPQTISNSVGGDLSGTTAAATVQGIQGKAVSTTAPTSGQTLVWSGTQWAPQTVSNSVGGDLSGTTAAATVQSIQGRSLSAAAPSTGQVLTWNGSIWLAQTPSGGGGGSVSIPEALVFDGSSTSLSDGSTVTWSACATHAICASWTIPAGVYWMLVDVWAGGGPGLGAGGGTGGAGGAGGGYGHRICPVTPGGTVSVQVGLGGISGSGFGASVTQGGDSSFGTCIGATASVILNPYAFGNPPGVMKVGTQVAPPGPWLSGNGFYTILTGVSGGSPSPSVAQTAGYEAVREDQGGWPGSGWLSGTGAGYPAGVTIGGGGGGGGGASQNAAGGAAGTSVFGGAGGAGGSSASACTAGSIPGGGGGGAFVQASGNTSGCNGARGEVRVYYVQ